MFWAAIIENELVGPFRVADGVKMTAKLYIDFIKEHLVPWHKKKNLSFRRKIVFMHDNAPSHAARLTTEYLQCFCGAWENYAMASLFPRFESHRKSVEHPETEALLRWEALHFQGRPLECRSDCCKDISSHNIESLTSSMDQLRLFSLIHKNGNYIQY